MSPGEEFQFPPAKKTIKAGERIRVKIPMFDALVGNFPFISQGEIEKADPSYKNKIAQALYQNWKNEYSDLFLNVDKKGNVELALSGQADIYAYMFFHAAAHLKPGGRMGFITSNSWLDVAYGYELQRFFLSKFKLVGIFESRCEPWFEQSAVNTVFTILERCDNKEEIEKNPVYFVKVKKPLVQLFPQDALMDAQRRWDTITRFVEKIEELGIKAENLGKLGFERSKGLKKFERINTEYVKQPEIVSYEDDEVRVRIIKQKDLKEEVETTEQTVKWGQYLRGPDIYFEILEKCADKLVPLQKVAEICRGFTTGINEFFYLKDDEIKHWGIEEEFLKPVLKSPKEFEGILIDPAKLTTKVFLCKKTKEDLRREGKTRALKYIEWGEKQKTKDGVPWPDVPTVRNRKPGWWALPEADLVQIFWTKSYDVKHLQRFSPDRLLADQRLYQVIQKNKVDTKALAGLMNCSLFSLSIELGGRVNLGDGALDTTVEETQDYLIIPDVTQLTNKQAKEIIQAFNTLITRSIKAIFEEIKMPDRQRMDSLVLKALGLDPKKYLKPLYNGLCELVGERLSLPKMRTVKKKKRIEHDLGKLKEEVTEDVLSSGVKRFPDAFAQAGSKTKWEEIGIGAEKIKLGERGIGVQEICDAEGNHLMEVRSIEKAKYIVYAKQKDEQIVKVPDSPIVIKKAVKDYEIYARQIKEELYRAFMEKCGDHSLSENLTMQVLEEHGLPEVR